MIQLWFNNHNPFIEGIQLVALDTGVVDSKNATCDQAEEIGLTHKSLDDQTFSNCKFKRKDHISSLKILYSPTQVEKEN